MCKRTQHMAIQSAQKTKSTVSQVIPNKTNIASLQRQLTAYINYANNKTILRYSKKRHKYYLGHSRRWNQIQYFIRKNKWKKRNDQTLHNHGKSNNNSNNQYASSIRLCRILRRSNPKRQTCRWHLTNYNVDTTSLYNRLYSLFIYIYKTCNKTRVQRQLAKVQARPNTLNRTINIKESILTNLKDRSFTSVILAVIIWFTASQVVLYFTYDVITKENYCKPLFKQQAEYYKCAKAVIINKYLTFLIPLALGLIAYYATKPRKKQNL